MKTLTQTINVQAEALPIEGSDLVLVIWSNLEAPDHVHNTIMKKDAFDKAQSPVDITPYTFIPDHFKKGEDYKGFFYVFSKEQYDHIMTGRNDFWDVEPSYEEITIKHGGSFTDNHVVVGVCNADYSFYDFDQKMINRPYLDTFLDTYYRIHDLVNDHEKSPLEGVSVIMPDHGRDPIFWVPGNGYEVILAFDIPDERFGEFKSEPAWYKKRFIEENTILGQYKRPIPLSENGLDDSWGDDD